MATRNQILLKKLKEKYPNLNINKPKYDDNYWDEILHDLKLVEKEFYLYDESNNITKKISK
jgi:hypothetical protein